MREIHCFDNWKIDENTPFGSGASKKYWMVDNKNQKGIFKYPKVSMVNNVSNHTGEFWAECLASDVAHILNISCAKVDVGIYHGEIGSMSYMILEENEQLLEGIYFISKEYPNYNKDELYDVETDTWYSIQMILRSLSSIYLDKSFLIIPIFDCLIGNSDRHHSNWGIVYNMVNKNMKLSPLYDNGSSLCSLVDENKVFLNDEKWMNALMHSKSKSMIRFENTKKRPTHFELLNYIAENFYKDTIGFIYTMSDILTDNQIDHLLYNYADGIISPKIKELLKSFLKARCNGIIDIYREKRKCFYAD